ncbi:hypothetical protein [Ornithinimicrobium pekingense]|nr:hypothetical protein [Ornithinimicrobium pekingense]
MADLPAEHRPAAWLDGLREARLAVPPSLAAHETAAVDRLLRG